MRLPPQSLGASGLALLLVSCGGSHRDVPVAAAPPVAAPRPAPPPEPSVKPVAAPSVEAKVILPPPTHRPPPPPPPPPPAMIHGSGVLEPATYTSLGGRKLPYRFYSPKLLEEGKRYPLVVFLHGASASGSDNQRQIAGAGAIGLAPWIDERTQSRHPSFVLAPQAAPKGSNWVRRWAANPSESPAEREPLELVIELVDRLVAERSIDPNRIYITGLSMGGFGTWIAISRHPGRFAAAVPVCGGGNPADVTDTDAAVWAFHGDADRVVPVTRSRQMIEALRRAGKDPRYTEYPGVRHDAWTRAFAEPELVDWLFSKRLAGSTAEGTPVD